MIQRGRVVHRSAPSGLSSLVAGMLAVAGCGDGGEACADGDCFAVFIMPDTQIFVASDFNDPYLTHTDIADFEEERSIHLEKTMEWVCSNREAWREPSTGASMRIALLIHLGDVVHSNTRRPDYGLPRLPGADRSPALQECLEAGYSEGECDCEGNHCEWRRLDRVLAKLDACRMPYLTVPGNHDFDGTSFYPEPRLASARTYSRYLGEGNPSRTISRRELRCSGLDADSCDATRGQWYLGGGGEPPCAPADAECPGAPPSSYDGGEWIRRNSRTAEGRCTNPPTQECGPPLHEAGRSRAGLIRSPKGHPFLFLGLDDGNARVEGARLGSPLEDALLWPARVLAANGGVPTVAFSHTGWGPAAPAEDLVRAYGQIFLRFHGHAYQENDVLREVQLHDGEPFRYWMLRRDYQNQDDNRHLIAAFDPGRGEVRLASYAFGLAGDPVLTPAPRLKLVDENSVHVEAHETVPNCSWSAADEETESCSAVDPMTRLGPERAYPIPRVAPHTSDTCIAGFALGHGASQVDSDGDGFADGCDD